VNFCRYCGRELPGLEKVCKDCFEWQYANFSAPKPKRDWIGFRTARASIPNGNKWVHVPFKFWIAAVALGVLVYFLSYVFLFVFLLVGFFGIHYVINSRRQARSSTLELTLLSLFLLTFFIESKIGKAQEYRLMVTFMFLMFLYDLIDMHRAN
jgi:hypothetical protein